MSKTIKFTIHNGQVEIESSGFKGSACEAATKIFEDVLGGNVASKKLKSEFYEKAPAARITTKS